MPKENQGCFGSILKLFGIELRASSSETIVEPLPYRIRDTFLSPAELDFFQVLGGIIGTEFYLCSKVRISDLLYVVNRNQNLGHANRIDRKHVDFVVCDTTTMQPKLIIELDNSTHARKDRIARDLFVDDAFAVAGLTVLHVPVQRQYSIEQLRQQIEACVQDRSISKIQSVAIEAVEGHMCPKCNIAMVERRAAKGRHKGKRFWACVSYPDCREIIPID